MGKKRNEGSWEGEGAEGRREGRNEGREKDTIRRKNRRKGVNSMGEGTNWRIDRKKRKKTNGKGRKGVTMGEEATKGKGKGKGKEKERSE